MTATRGLPSYEINRLTCDIRSAATTIIGGDQRTRCNAIFYLTTALLFHMTCSCVFGKDSIVDEGVKSRSKSLPLAGEVFTVKGHPAFLIMPGRAAGVGNTPWVWYAPTLQNLPGTEERWMFQRFLDAGIAIAGIDVGESYGSPEGRVLFSALYEELVQSRGLSQMPCLLARSRGGLMLYNWAVENPFSVTCVAAIYPVCNLNSYPGIESASKAYAMTAEQLKAELAEHNPIDRLAPLAQAQVPLFHIHGDSDTVVPLEENSAELMRRYRKLDGVITLKVIKGQGHDRWPGWFQNQQLVDFVISQAHQDKPNSPDSGNRK